MDFASGASRFVILSGRLAVKVPHPGSWRRFLHGLLANDQEALFGRSGWPELCPVVFSLPGGFLLVMRRAKPCSDADALDFDALTNRPDYVIPAEPKPSSWGWLDGRVVAIDYG